MTLFVAGGLGDFNFGEIGGVDEVLVGSGGDIDGSESDFGGNFLIEFLLSRFGTMLHVGWRKGLPLILATSDVAVAVVVLSMPTLVLELHIFLFC